ncbi:MAG: arabinan endo-1,5-alpha-L-arabinosidase [Spirochaetia bacterium]
MSSREVLALIACLAAPVQLIAAPAYAHDPVIIKANGAYFLFSTGQGIAMKRSTDLLSWEFLPPVFRKIPEWMRREVPGFYGDLWAPDVVFANGRYYLYCAASTFGSNRSCIGLATNVTLDPSRPDYLWADQGMVIGSVPGRDDWNAIDPNLFIDDAAHWYLAFGSFWGGIKMIEVDPETGLPAVQTPQILSLARRPGVKDDPIEAPCLYRHGGFYYLFVSFDYCCRGTASDYKIAVGRSRSVAGPYLDAAGTSMLDGGGTIVLQSSGDVHGPGHNSILVDGDSQYIVHHMYDGKRGGAPVLQVRPLGWSDSGWPVAGEPRGTQ